MSEKGSGVGMFFLGMLTGAVVGGLAALFLTPKTGKETRQLVKDKSMEWRDAAQRGYTDFKDRFTRARECLRTPSGEKGTTSGNGK